MIYIYHVNLSVIFFEKINIQGGIIGVNKEILNARKNVGLTQEKASNKIGVTLRTYQKYETGECIPNAKIAVKIAEVLHTTVEKLFSTNQLKKQTID